LTRKQKENINCVNSLSLIFLFEVCLMRMSIQFHRFSSFLLDCGYNINIYLSRRRKRRRRRRKTYNVAVRDNPFVHIRKRRKRRKKNERK